MPLQIYDMLLLLALSFAFVSEDQKCKGQRYDTVVFKSEVKNGAAAQRKREKEGVIQSLLRPCLEFSNWDVVKSVKIL